MKWKTFINEVWEWLKYLGMIALAAFIVLVIIVTVGFLARKNGEI